MAALPDAVYQLCRSARACRIVLIARFGGALDVAALRARDEALSLHDPSALPEPAAATRDAQDASAL